jgi:hypothetical protein
MPMKLHVIPISEQSDHPYYPLTAAGNEEELKTVINQVILDDEELETKSVRGEIMGVLPPTASLADIVKWVNRHSHDLEVVLELDD